ncbi:hypothetical protein [Butyribacter intestini]|mgnify:FL=1|jgi:hypothetical protein|uniref:Lipoprotein n=1 Tax=Butyribacter intestini TaxID=1703332 RepID=A0AAW3JUX4_9FIRM|nr:hypothetical protein [Butyribacter intestini]KQC86046.1 hypothetical protein APZ18_02305 [Butyribacter intestini]RHU77150.1 hypothetical protein DXC30_02340 [Butyribacter intestini]DAE81662.1 MAG TPA: hypothetical protein [Caudoviricetes sp.]
MKKFVSLMLIFALLLSKAPCETASAKTKLLCKDKRIEVYYKQTKKGKIYFTYKNKSKLDIRVDVRFIKINGKSYYSDYEGKVVVAKESRVVKLELYDEDEEEVKYKFKKGKLSGQFEYFSEDDDISYHAKLNFKNKNIK